MPSEDDSERATMMELCVSKEWLFQELLSDPSRLVILDCRSSNEYGESHIKHAVNFSIPSIMLRRLAAGKIDLMSTIKCRELKAKIMNAYKENVFVVYGDFNVTEKQARTQQQSASFNPSDTLHVLAKRLAQDGCQVVCLEGGFCSFRSCYPEWCESCSELMVSDSGPGSMEVVPLMGLRSLRISATSQLSKRQHHLDSSCSSAATSSTDSSDSDDRCDSSLGLEEDRDFPVKILPHLFLGNATTSGDSEALSRHSIEYILNVTADLPNVFEDSGSIRYMKIPIADHWKENLASFFPKAIEFIDEARSNEKGVLVHCLAGVSRSVTVTVAYLMYKLSLNLNDAFNMVRARKSNIAPNFHFMQQLHNFECELARSPKDATDPTQGTESEQMKSESGTVSDSAVAQTTSTAAEARCCTDPDCVL
ncbi:dual specificity protein phosphatase Mpk3 isoform X2 [Zootermopsis nevadensis]|uniref:dual specificity protein phosphatase Mpk3 isoform X2 n=1 Tax=Zootermopsis nevadensis TaxID=136037 RepID=UPI000B8EDAF8|nr:dual specificity protein phosphatase Mpk3 isoform X2 [Zootermopsis nevadensis]